jgi:hypothetical protein
MLFNSSSCVLPLPGGRGVFCFQKTGKPNLFPWIIVVLPGVVALSGFFLLIPRFLTPSATRICTSTRLTGSIHFGRVVQQQKHGRRGESSIAHLLKCLAARDRILRCGIFCFLDFLIIHQFLNSLIRHGIACCYLFWLHFVPGWKTSHKTTLKLSIYQLIINYNKLIFTISECTTFLFQFYLH